MWLFYLTFFHVLFGGTYSVRHYYYVDVPQPPIVTPVIPQPVKPVIPPPRVIPD